MTNRRVFIAELQDLTNEVICMGNAVEIMIGKVEQAVRTNDLEIAQEVIEGDELINAMESKIERECIDLIAKQQPVASDLRRVSACMRLISDLERIGDHCADISAYIIQLSTTGELVTSETFYSMFAQMRIMVHNTIKSFAKEDVVLAQSVMSADNIVDDYFAEELARIKKDLAVPVNIEFHLIYLLIIKYVERMADHAGNIAEWVQFLVEGNLEESMHMDKHDFEENE
ncbi:MAG: phosphate signaling complex protein PhoU [Eubacteriales bacterium]